MKVERGARINLHFSLALADGAVVDSNFAGKPATCMIGDGSLPPAFEQELLGLEAGDEIERTMPPERAFGVVNSANLHRFPAANFSSLLRDALAPLVPGSVVMFRDAGGSDRPGVIRSVGDLEVEVDFNHPLAGREIVFRALIVSVLAPGTSRLELEQGLENTGGDDRLR